MRQHRLDRTSVIALAVGLAAPLQIELVGVVYGGEVLLALVALWALASNLANPGFWRRPFITLLLCLVNTLGAYVITDLIHQTEAPNLWRGGARLIFLGSNFIGFYFLCRRNHLNVIVYAVGSAFGILLYLSWTGRLLDNWKFGASAPVTLLIAGLIPLVARRGALWGSLALAAVGVLHMSLDSREIGGNCLLAGVLLFARCSSILKIKLLSWVMLGAVGSAGAGLVYAFVVSDQEYAQRRLLSNAWRTASLLTAANGIVESPWIGNGSQANNFEFQSRYDSIFAERTGMRYRGQQTDTSTFSPHSQILQAWFEAGLAGTAFFVYLGWKLLAAFKWCVFRRRPDAYSVLFAFCLLRATWHLLFSPFAGLARADVALAAAIVCVLEMQRSSLRGFAS